ncbi:MAG: hypothetical protein PHE38_16335 [Alishewanella agri]|nr:hypothetical protein [Alishewanella agri]
MTVIKHYSDNSPLPLNQDLSSCLNDEQVEQLFIQQRQLKHLDLYQVSSLMALSIDCPEPAERHLRIQGASALKTVQLSGHPDNRWVIHLDLEKFPHGLSIEAPIEHFDMCWLQEHELMTLTPKHQIAPWQGVLFYDLSQMTLADFNAIQNLPAQSLVVCCGGDQHSVVPTFANIEQLLFTDISGINCLTVSQVKHLVVQRAIGLRSIALLDKGLSSLQLHQCPQFCLLSAEADFSADEAKLTDTAHGNLELAGHWDSVKLRSSALTELSAGQIEQLHVTHCPNLKRLRVGTPLIFTDGSFDPELLDQVSFSINEGTIRNTLEKLTEQMDQELVEALLQQALRQHRPNNVGHAIMLLQALAELGYDILKLWELRAVLYQKNQRRQLNFRQDPTNIKLLHWRWNIKVDRLYESYEADFLLWHKANQQGLTDAKKLMPIMAHSALVDEPAAFFTLCTMLANNQAPLDSSEKVAFLDVLIQKKLSQTNTWLNLNDRMLPGLNRLCHYFKQQCAAVISSNNEQHLLMLKVLFKFLLYSISPKLLSGILPAAMQLFPEYVRPQLLAMANDSLLNAMSKFADVSYDSVKVWYTKAALAKAS